MAKRGRPLSSDWLKTNEAAIVLGITARQLRKIRPGLKHGYHYRTISRAGAIRPAYIWNRLRLEEFLSIPLEKR